MSSIFTVLSKYACLVNLLLRNATVDEGGRWQFCLGFFVAINHGQGFMDSRSLEETQEALPLRPQISCVLSNVPAQKRAGQLRIIIDPSLPSSVTGC